MTLSTKQSGKFSTVTQPPRERLKSFVFHSTMSDVLEPMSASIDMTIDVDARKADVTIPDLAESKGTPIINKHTGFPHRARINFPNGFE